MIKPPSLIVRISESKGPCAVCLLAAIKLLPADQLNIVFTHFLPSSFSLIPLNTHVFFPTQFSIVSKAEYLDNIVELFEISRFPKNALYFQGDEISTVHCFMIYSKKLWVRLSLRKI